MSSRTLLRIGQLASATGTNTPTIRYYESIGLLPAPQRQDGGQRRYDADAITRLTLVRRCREFGFSIEQVKVLADLIETPTSCCTDARDMARLHLEGIRTKLAELRALEQAVAQFVHECEDDCMGGPGPACVPLVGLSRTPIGSM